MKADIRHLEFNALKKLDTPQKIQDFINKIPVNKELRKETLCSPLFTLRRNKAHCIEGALLAALVLKMHGHPPILMDLRATKTDFDHVIALFKKNGFWGAISKSNHAVLRYREPIYKNPRELAMSFFHEYFDNRGRKNLREYSDPFNLDKYARKTKAKWIISPKNLWKLAEDLDSSQHHKLINSKQIKNLRKADKIEIKAGKIQGPT
ncbi:hypothetical protein KGQ24_00005 [Patescibacteria group bacterium]|nr:hypothetical protein [Patescibacteria group bacterium]